MAGSYSSNDNYQNLFSESAGRDPGKAAIVRQLKFRVDKLELITEALWELLKEKTDLDETDLIERVAQIDIMDGKYDRKRRKVSVIKCKRCGRMNSKKHTQCLYCGDVFLLGPFE